MRINFKNYTALAIAFGIGAFAVIQSAAAQDNCAWYALNSAKQQQVNLQKNCGFKGDEWSKNVREHRAWCETVAPEVWQKKMDMRQKALDGCK